LKGVIVSNATPIIAFSRINRLDLFQQVTGAIVIPQEVEKEL
jgi:predicted nucleic acid-binding protein